MRRLLGGVLVGVAALVLVLPAPSAGQDGSAAAAGYDFFRVYGLADGVTTRVVVREMLPVEEVALSSVSAESTLDTGRSTALAVMPDPGDFVLALPGTVAGLAGIPGLPDYPAAARADHPFAPRDEVNLVPDAGLGALRLLAEAEEQRALGEAYAANLVDTVGALPGFSVGSVRSQSLVRQVAPLVYEASARTTTNDVRFLGGLFRIGELTTVVTARVDNGEVSAVAEETSISGAEVGGTPVGIGREGLTAPNGSQALQPVIDQLAAPLADAGFSVSSTPGEVVEKDGEASATSGTVRVDFRTLLQDRYPALYSVTFGQSVASVAVGGTTDDVVSGGDDLGLDTPAGDLGSGGDALAGGLGDGLDATAGLDDGTAATSGVGGDAGDDGGEAQSVTAVTELMDFRDLYRMMALAAIALVVARRWAVGQAHRLLAPPRPDLRPKWRW